MNTQKDDTLLRINTLLKSLHTHFPWLVVEIIFGMQERIGKENPFVQMAVDGTLDDLSKEVLDEYIPECSPADINSPEIPMTIFSFFQTKKLKDILGKEMPQLQEEMPDACLPWDTVEKDIFAQGHFLSKEQMEKVNMIGAVKSMVEVLKTKKIQLEENPSEFKNEIGTINIIIDTLKT